MRKWKLFFVAFILLTTYTAYGQGSLTLSISHRVIGSKDALRATYIFKNLSPSGVPNIKFKGWEASTPSKQNSIVSINGAVTRSISYSYTLFPKHIGKLSVPGFSTTINGKAYTCDKATVTVKKKAHIAPPQMANTSPGVLNNFPFSSGLLGLDDVAPMARRIPPTGVLVHPGESNEMAAQKDFFIKVTPSKYTCYLGEPISVNYEFLGAINCAWKPENFPTFSSFSVIDIQQDMYPYAVEVNGKNYRARSIRKAQLVPLKTGTIPLDSASVSCQTTFVQSTDLYNAQEGSVIIRSSPKNIQVLPLPTANRPTDFSGAIGSFTISAYVDQNKLPANENNVLHILISGHGNLDGVTLPKISWPQLTQSYDAKDSQSVDKTQFPMPLSLNFDIPFIGNKEGIAVIPPIKFSYFDADKKKYIQIASDSIQLQFTPAVINNRVGIINHTTNKKYLWIVALMAIVILGIYYFRERATQRKQKNNSSKEPKVAFTEPATDTQEHASTTDTVKAENYKAALQAPLKELAQEVDSKQFFVLAKALLIQNMQDKLQTTEEEESLLLTQLAKRLPDAAPTYQQLIARCNKALYMPTTSNVVRDEVLKAIKGLLD